MTKHVERDMFVAVIATETRLTAGAVADIVNKLVRYSTKHVRLCENLCNFPGEWARDLDRVERDAREYVERTMGLFGVKVEFQRDPRSYTMRLTFSQMRGPCDYQGVPTNN